ncbi:MAG: putative bifunctional diguanylate cyclase/phosphodiesterase [Acidobacteriota bacterium]
MGESVIRILLIEDNPDDVLLIRRFLERPSPDTFSIEHADRLAKGLARLNQGEIDLVLLDLSLPDSDHSNTFSELRRYAPRVPIIILSGMADKELAFRAVRGGAQDYLVKSGADRDRLTRSIRYALERKRWAEALRESEERYALAVRGANDGLWDWDLKSNRIYFSPRWLSMLGMEEELPPESPEAWFERVHPEDIRLLRGSISDHLDGKTPFFEREHRLRHGNGRHVWVLSRGIAVRDGKGEAYRMAGSLTDISERKRFEEQLRHDALHDSLTGLPNRLLLLDRLEISIARSHRNPSLFAVLFLDLDRFKNVNDSQGHSVGDKLLKALSARLAPLLREGDTVARLGGDEFAILLNDIRGPADASRVAERIQREVSAPFSLDGYEVFTSASIGIALSSNGYQRAEEILRDADTAMYQAKSNGKAQHVVFGRHMHERVVAALNLENDLRRAVERDEFRVHYQPIINLENGRIRAFEALVRWQHPERGLLLPVTFIPTAEETGLIVPIGRFVMREACGQLSSWRRRFDLNSLSMNVNLSGKEFMEADLVDSVLSVLEESGLEAPSLRLEITESILMEQATRMEDKLQRFRDLQIELHIDDFGTGYSSLNYLHQLPASGLKIDRSFVRWITGGDGRSKIIRTIVALARNLGMNVAVEGLETAEELAHLRTLECEYAQGYYLSKPLDGADAGQLLLSQPQW